MNPALHKSQIEMLNEKLRIHEFFMWTVRTEWMPMLVCFFTRFMSFCWLYHALDHFSLETTSRVKSCFIRQNNSNETVHEISNNVAF